MENNNGTIISLKDIVVEFDGERIIEIIERKYKRCFEDEKQKQRAINGLLRLGYSYSEIKDAFCRIKEDEEFSFSEVEDEYGRNDIFRML